jgi:hypothetical protein
MEDKRIEVIIKDTNFQTLGIVDNASSIIWRKKYNETGQFEIKIMANLDNARLLQKNYYVFREDDDSVGIIEDINYTEDEENGDFLLVAGRFAEKILGQRVVWAQTNLYGTAEIGIRNLILDNIINPLLPERKIDIIALGQLKQFTERINSQVTGANIEEYIKEVCKTFGYGYRLLFYNNKFYFELYKGVNRSYSQTENTYVVFNKKLDNIITSEYNEVNSTVKNVALVAGEGEGVSRKTFVVGNAEGINRKEIFVDAKDVSSNEGELTDGEYYPLLEQRGSEKLSEHTTTQSFDSEINLGNYQYGKNKDFYLGDIVTEENEELGIYLNARIIEVIEAYDENGYSIIPTFGS